ncbi:App1 family protein [Alsobacter sp. SYSU BS001988]
MRSPAAILAAMGRSARRLLAAVARPVARAQGRGGVALLPYRGYGSRSEVFLIGRVFRQSDEARQDRRGGVPGQIRNVLRRITRGAVEGAAVTARFCGAQERVTTDRDGYFRIHLRLAAPPAPDRSWHEVDLELEEPRVAAKASVFIPPDRCRFVVISDIDDTVVETGIANRLVMLWRLFVEDAESRIAFPGVAALYQALHGGLSGRDGNPMLYVSRAPWGTYEVLEEFFQIHRIPVGPILFLREWGVSWTSPLPREARSHKEDLIRRMLALYDALPFVLIGDSGQHDPEIYRRIVEENPGRVLGVFIRDVSHDPARVRDMERLAMAVSQAGSTLLLASDSVAMAEQAVKLGLVGEDTPAVVRSNRQEQEPQPPEAPTTRVSGATPQATARAVAEGGLATALDATSPEAPGPNVVVEPDERRSARPPPAP